ncbi:MAG: choice-of-anchor B family protein [Bacteroidia bacterium]
MAKLDNFNNPNLPKVDGSDIWNDITGWANPIDGKEYAIAGSTDSIYIFLITDDNKLHLVDVEFGVCRFARNRDYETYKNFLYTVADQATGLGALQIFDLSFLPDSVHKVYESREFTTFTHTIFIDSASKRLYLCGNSGSGAPNTLRILGLNNPEKPTLLADLIVPTINGTPVFTYVHEMYARNDTVYLSTGTTGLYIFDLTNLQNQRLLSIIKDYPFKGYNHSSWLDPSGKYLLFTDENIGLNAKVFDISNLAEPKFVSSFNSNPEAMPHNAYWYGDFAYVSAYHDGVQVWDLKQPENPVRVAWFETYTETPKIYSGFKGCWGVYPYLPSKRILASDLTSGIWLLSIDSNLVGIKNIDFKNQSITAFPNPASNLINLNLGSNQIIPNFIRLLNITASESYVAYKTAISGFDVSKIPNGLYILEVRINNQRFFEKVLISR